jgi:hypothetical protein
MVYLVSIESPSSFGRLLAELKHEEDITTQANEGQTA